MESQRDPSEKDSTSCSDQTKPPNMTLRSSAWHRPPKGRSLLLHTRGHFTTTQMRKKNHTDLDKELAPKEPTLQNMGLVPGPEPVFSVRFLSGDRAAAAIGCDVAVRLANGFSSLV